jgi:hypothetical protein
MTDETLQQLQREWHNKVAELQRIGRAIALHVDDPFADPFATLSSHLFAQQTALDATFDSFKSNFLKPLP